jgi:hypothetical protein
MTLHLTGHVALPEHKAKGGFDHAAVHAASGAASMPWPSPAASAPGAPTDFPPNHSSKESRHEVDHS